jgi:hypothetical protein
LGEKERGRGRKGERVSEHARDQNEREREREREWWDRDIGAGGEREIRGESEWETEK